MKQVIRKSVAMANNIDNVHYINSVIFDMNNIMKRASVDHRVNSDGTEYGIVLTSLGIIGKILRKKDFDYCIAAYDGEGSGVMRWEYYNDYKANRDKHYELYSDKSSEYYKSLNDYARKVINYSRNHRPEVKRSETDDESFDRQKRILQEILEELCIRQYEYEKVEGDDIIAYYAKNKKPNERLVIVSSDKDLTQLISDDIIIYSPVINDFITKNNAVEKMGIRYDNVVLEKMICGDTSDNIKGIKGMGEATLKKLFPEMAEKKVDLNAILERSRVLLEERKQNKKKPLKSLENILNKVTDGIQGEHIYEINKKIIDLSEPMLTEEALRGLYDELYAPIDISDRGSKNIYRIIQENNLGDMMDEGKFGSLFSPFSRIMMMEKRRFEAISKKSQ